MSMIRSREEIIKDIADKINDGKKIELEKVTKKDIKSLKDFDYIITPGLYSNIMIRRKFEVDSVLGIPTVFWSKIGGEYAYEIADEIMGTFPEALTLNEVYEEIMEFKGIIE